MSHLNLRISTTTLESYRLWSDPEQEWMPEEELLDTIKGVFKPNAKMLLGQAFGRAIEKADKYRRQDSQGDYYAVPVKDPVSGWKEYIFPGKVVNPCLEKFDRRGVFECKSTRIYGGVTVVAKADQILGNVIIENKTKLSTFDFQRYQDSYQWRFMLDIFQAASVHYNVFCLDSDGTGDEHDEIKLKGIEEFNLYPYPSLHDDCCELLTKFLGYVSARQLEPYLIEKQYA